MIGTLTWANNKTNFRMTIWGTHISFKTILLGIGLTPLFNFIEKYIYNDWEFLIWISLLILLDTFTGTWKALEKKEFSSRGFAGLIKKLVLYMTVLVLSHALEFYTVQNKINGIFYWIDNAICSILMLREVISILENVAQIEPGLVPKWLVKKLKAMQNEDPDDRDNKQV